MPVVNRDRSTGQVGRPRHLPTSSHVTWRTRLASRGRDSDHRDHHHPSFPYCNPLHLLVFHYPFTLFYLVASPCPCSPSFGPRIPLFSLWYWTTVGSNYSLSSLYLLRGSTENKCHHRLEKSPYPFLSPLQNPSNPHQSPFPFLISLFLSS